MNPSPGTNRMNPETRLVHARLEAWARWCKESLNGFPANTILGRMADGELPGFQSRPPINLPEAIAVTDKAVGRLPLKHQQAIREYYGNWAPPEVIARRLNLSPREFARLLETGRLRVHCYIEMLEDYESGKDGDFVNRAANRA